ncbi:MAG TPA: folylpolyglutamate synthase/dihydrofolate synthase family protein, partial [Steroidobacteraceae bacterium]|nr:folylpolyglutamate synthase/dihydrofolate synthase family protein [Steroidobacteraceae bacterium]
MRTLAEWLALQESVHPKSIDLDLTRVTAVARTLGVAEPAFAVLTVGGTNGKGSVAAHLEALFAARGVRTGLFTSPHFIRYNERIRLGGREVDDAALVAAFERIEAARAATTLTFFEYNTLAALLIFAAHPVDVAVLEVGLGGRLDATNLIDADVAVLASVGFDHRDWLGDTLEQIGTEKAGIFRAGRPAVLGTPAMPGSVFAALARLEAQAVVAERDFSWRTRGAHWDYDGLGVTLHDLPAPALAGAIQYRNAATAIAAMQSLGGGRAARGAAVALARRLGPLDAPLVGGALAQVRLAGRFQIVPGPVEWILDIAHNEPAAQVLAAQLAARPPPGGTGARTFAVIGVLTDKDAPAIGAALAPVIDRWIVCALPGARGSSAAE